jgi:hypothetical protein
MGWRDQYQVHPAADVFPMMPDEELAALGADIKANGLREPIVLIYASKPVQIAENTFGQDTVLIDGRNRLEAMERAGLRRDDCGDPLRWVMANYSRGPFDFDVAAYVISKNMRRRHLNLTKAQQADLIVAAIKAGEEYSANVAEKSRGRPKSELKSKACELAAKADISERTVERAIAKAEGKAPKKKRRTKAEIAEDLHEHQMAYAEAIGHVTPIHVARRAYLVALDALEPGDVQKAEIEQMMTGLRKKLS